MQLWILDGNKYNTRVREAGEQRVETLIDCEVLRNQKGEPLLTSAAGSNDATQPHLNLKFQPTTCTVPLRWVGMLNSSMSLSSWQSSVRHSFVGASVWTCIQS